MRGRCLLSLVLGAALGLTGAPAVAVAAPAAGEAGPGDPVYDEARALYDEGRGKFETADYSAAIDLWTQAYTKLPNKLRYAKIKVLLLYDLSTARERAYEVDNRASHLRQARILLENFEASIPSIYGEGHEATAERERVQERLALIDEKLAEAGEGDPEPEPTSKGGDTPAPTPVVVMTPEDEAPKGPKNPRALLIAGGTLMAVGAGALGLMAGGMVMGQQANDIDDLEPGDVQGRRKRFDRGRLGNGLAVAGGVAGGALIITGAALIGVSRKGSGSSKAARVVPAAGPGFAGLSVSGRF